MKLEIYQLWNTFFDVKTGWNLLNVFFHFRWNYVYIFVIMDYRSLDFTYFEALEHINR